MRSDKKSPNGRKNDTFLIKKVVDGKLPDAEICDLFKQVATHFPAGLLLLTDNGEIEDANSVSAQILNSDIDELAGQSLHNFIYKDDHHLFIDFLSAIEESPSDTISGELRIIDSDLTIRWIEIRARKNSESISYLWATITDITTQKCSYLAINESLNRHHRLLEAYPDLLFFIDHTGRIIDYKKNDPINPFLSHDIKGKSVKELLPTKFSNFIISKISLVLQNHTQENFIYHLIHAGEKRYFEGRMVAVNETDVMVVSRDITENAILRKALKTSQNNYKELIDLVVGAVFVLSKAGIIEIVNKHTLKLLGKKKSQIIGHDMASMFPPEELIVNPLRYDLLLKGHLVKREREFLCAEGRVTVELFSRLMPDGKFMLVAYDISERRAKENELVSKNRELKKIVDERDRFFSIIAHDLRNPFNAFLGLTELLTHNFKKMTRKEIEETIHQMNRSARNSYLLLENLLEWSRLKRSNINYRPEEHSLTELLSSSIDLVREQAVAKKIAIGMNIPGEPKLFVDPYMTKCLLRNLITNAIKFSFRGSSISIATRELSSGFIEIQVKDSGIGMKPELLTTLFDVDAKTQRQGTENEMSSGLGLVLCKEFAEIQGGTIRAESQEMKGSTFFVTLPLSSISHS